MATLIGYIDGNSGWSGWPSGTAAGDVALVTATCNGDLGNMTGWEVLPLHSGMLTGSNVDGAWKLLDADDITNGPPVPSVPQGFAMMVVVRGAIAVEERSAGNVDNTGTSTIPGFTKDPDSQMIVVLQADRDPADVVGYPTGWTGIDSSVGTYFLQKLSYKHAADYGGEDIACPLPTSQYDGLGIAYEFTGTALDTVEASFVGPMGAFASELKLTGRIEDASFVGPMGSFDALLVSLSGDPIEEYIQQDSARLVLESTATGYSDTSPPSYQAAQISFVGPMGRSSTRLTLWPEAEANFVGPHGRFNAALEYGNVIEAGFIGPHGSFSAELDINGPRELSASFVGPSSVFNVQLELFAVDAGFVGPSSAFAASLLSTDGLFAHFVGPGPQFDAELDMTMPLEASFVGPFGYFSGQLGEDVRSVAADFVGPSGRFDAEMYAPESVVVGFVGPMGRTAAQLDVIEEINAGFVGPIGSFNVFIGRGPGIDAFFRGPRPNFNAELEREATGMQLNLMLIQP
jgi:hypothetical protein